ncbi:MAG: TM0106 family RecB-like putative nuclease [Ignavibacteriales bacterium]|nr:TM0106 family RecB-like putative nuclease [Ignavibacteriales bacterium]
MTPEVVVAYSQCSRKAYFLLRAEGQGMPHEYVRLLEEQASRNRIKYLNRIEQEYPGVRAGNAADLSNGKDMLVEVPLRLHDLAADCDVLMKVHRGSSLGSHSYEPMIIVGTHQVTKEQKLALLFVGYVLGQLQEKLPAAGKIVGADGRAHKVGMKSADRTVVPIIKALRQWTGSASSTPPIVILNKCCPTCQFRKGCLEHAETNDDLSLLDRITPKTIRKYHKKGIFTVTQLSYVFKPRRSRKRRTKAPVSFKVELQALALRTGKIYIQELPTLPRHEVELFLDLEGIPDENFYYLIGVQINEQGNRFYYSFWANTPEDEQRIWAEALEKINEHPEAPIYHYGSYEPRAIDALAQKYQTDCDALKKRLVNLNACVYGKVYFPTRSNNLKELGKLVGASWTSPDASGLQSLVWRHHWEEKEESQYREMLVTYNREDCEAVWLLAEELSKIIASADTHVNIDFADRPKQHATELGNEIHEKLQSIIRYAHADYDKKRVSIRPQQSTTETERKNRGGVKGHQAYNRIVPSKAGTVIKVAPKRICPRHKGESLQKSEEMAEKCVINLRFTKIGCRKTVTKYVGAQGYCQKCRKHYLPPKIEELGNRLFGHAFQAWVIYQRIVLRIPYRIISQEMENLFNERASEGTLINFIKYFAVYYAETEKFSILRILEGPFIHADETRINIQGVDHYVWVFTNGKHVVFRMTETREATIVHEFLSDYKGVLISDFYGGYDAVVCRQQKCLVHLIRDLNDDLWNDPYNREYEVFVSEVKNLLIPILEAEKKYGLKKCHLSKFGKSVDRFYRKNIDKEASNCDLVAKYQKRFQRYRGSLFTFLESNGIPWHNNTAENAIRHLAVQRKISGTFYKKVAPLYLLLLGIAQTCRFQDKSLLKFFLSEEIDIDKFKAAKRIKISSLVGPSRDISGHDPDALEAAPNKGLQPMPYQLEKM